MYIMHNIQYPMYTLLQGITNSPMSPRVRPLVDCLVGRSVCRNFLKGREVTLQRSYRSTCLQGVSKSVFYLSLNISQTHLYLSNICTMNYQRIYQWSMYRKVFIHLLEVKFLYDPVCQSVGLSAFHNFQKGRVVSLPYPYRSTCVFQYAQHKAKEPQTKLSIC